MSAGHAEMSIDMTDLAPGVDVDVFISRFLAHTASQLPGYDEERLSALVRSALEFGVRRQPGETLLRVRDVDADTTAVDIVTGDVPYLVDSVRAELERRNCPAERVLHPQLVVRRDADGRLAKVYDVDDNAAVPEDSTVESWMYIELDDIPAEQHEQLAARPAQRPRRRAQRGRGRPDDVPAHAHPRPRPGRGPRRVRPGDQRGGRRAAALAGRRQLHDPRAHRLLRQRAGQPPRPGRGHRCRGRAARRRAHLTARAAARLPQRRADGDLQVPAGVDGAPLGPLRLRHGDRRGQARPAADHPRLPRPDHRHRGRHGRPGAGGAPPHRRDPAALRRARRQPHRPAAARRAAHAPARRAARGADRRPAAAGPARRRPLRAPHRRRVRAHPPQPRLRQRAGRTSRPTGSGPRSGAGCGA